MKRNWLLSFRFWSSIHRKSSLRWSTRYRGELVSYRLIHITYQIKKLIAVDLVFQQVERSQPLNACFCLVTHCDQGRPHVKVNMPTGRRRSLLKMIILGDSGWVLACSCLEILWFWGRASLLLYSLQGPFECWVLLISSSLMCVRMVLLVWFIVSSSPFLPLYLGLSCYSLSLSLSLLLLFSVCSWDINRSSFFLRPCYAPLYAYSYAHTIINNNNVCFNMEVFLLRNEKRNWRNDHSWWIPWIPWVLMSFSAGSAKHRWCKSECSFDLCSTMRNACLSFGFFLWISLKMLDK